MAFLKLDREITESSIWLEDADVFKCFMAALLNAKAAAFDEPIHVLDAQTLEPAGWTLPPGTYGVVDRSVRMFLERARVGIGALVKLCSPDRDSRDKSHDGRRLVVADGAIIVLNFERWDTKDHTAADRQRRSRAKRVTSQGSSQTNAERHGESRVTDRDVTQREGKREGDGEGDGEQAPPPPATTDPDDLDDPEIRSVGQSVGPTSPEPHTPPPRGVDQELAELGLRHGEFVGAQPAGSGRERAAAARPSIRDDDGRTNLRRELDARGFDGVLEVIRFGWGEAAAGRWEPKRVAFAFAKSGGWFSKLVAERAEALAKAEVADLAAKRREEIDRVEAERAAQARGSPGATEVDIDAVTNRLRRRGRATG